MEGIFGILLLLLLLLVIGAVLGWVAFVRVNDLSQKLNRISAELTQLKQFTQLKQSKSSAEPPPAAIAPPHSTPRPESESAVAGAASVTPAADTALTNLETKDQHDLGLKAEAALAHGSRPTQIRQANPKPRWQSHLVEHWMTWLGGISVALAGVFMVKYSINVGMLGPQAQISLAILTGLMLHGVADWLRRRNKGSDPVFASLAGGASITLYAALLAALHLYQLIEPGWAFMALAAVSLATMALSLAHGPMLAMIGLIGGYVVPLLVNTNSGNMVGALVYSLIISSAALLLIRFVFRPWLWWSVVLGALGWWLLSLSSHQADIFRGLYLAIFAWALLAIPNLDWSLTRTAAQTRTEADIANIPVTARSASLNQLALVLVVLAWGGSIYWQGESAIAFGLWAPLVLVAAFAAMGRESLWALPWLTLLVQVLAWVLMGIEQRGGAPGYRITPLSLPLQEAFLIYAALMAALYSVLSAWHWRRHGFSHPPVALALLAPLVFLALAYIRVKGLSQSLVWSLTTLLAGSIYALMAGLRLQRDHKDGVALWLTLGAHLAYSLAVALYFREAQLSLALAAQLLSLTWLIKRYELPWLVQLTKAVLAIVMLRLTFNPWLVDYPSDIHWSLWTYGGATLFALAASRQCAPSSNLRAWLEAATLHLLVLTLGTELRYWLYDGEIFVRRYDVTEAAINTSLWAALALAYWHRAKVSESLTGLYQACSKILLVMALASYAILALIHNPWWSGVRVSETPLFNLLLLAYGAPVIWALAVAYYHDPTLRKFALRLAGVALMLFIALEIRQLWQGSNLALNRSTGDGELYSYSVVWMLMAIAGILLGTRWHIIELYKVGMGLLSLVIAKIFLIDMSGLDGLWRVAAFMGLGLALLALAWVYKRMRYEGVRGDLSISQAAESRPS